MRTVLWAMGLGFIGLAVANGQPPAANPVPPAAQEVLERMDKEIAIAKTKAMTSLEKILKDTTKKGDLQGALAVKAAMEKLQLEARVVPAGAATQFVGRWSGPGWTAESFPDGTIVYSNGVKGRWRESGRTVRLELDNTDIQELSRTDEGYLGVHMGGAGAGTQVIYRRINGSP